MESYHTFTYLDQSPTLYRTEHLIPKGDQVQSNLFSQVFQLLTSFDLIP